MKESNSSGLDIVKLNILLALIRSEENERLRTALGKSDFSQNSKNIAFFEAAQSGFNEAIKILLVNGANKNYQEPIYNMTALHVAIQNGREEVIKALIDNHVDLDLVNIDGDTSLKYAVNLKMVKVAEDLLVAGANPNIVNKMKASALSFASQEGYDEIVRLLLEKAANKNEQDINGCTPLILASMFNQEAAAKELILNGADVNVQKNDGKTALFYAVIHGNTNIVSALLLAKSDPNIDNKVKISPLISAISKDYNQITEMLLMNGANKNYQTVFGVTPLMNATSLGKQKIVCKLIENNQEGINIQSEDGNTALIIAATNDDIAMSKILLAAGADPNISDNNGLSPLIIASFKGSKKLVVELLSYKADKDHKDGRGNTALLVVAAANKPDIVEILLSAGANTNIKNNRGMTALSLSNEKGHKKISKLIANNVKANTTKNTLKESGDVPVITVMLANPNHTLDEEEFGKYKQSLCPQDLAMLAAHGEEIANFSNIEEVDNNLWKHFEFNLKENEREILDNFRGDHRTTPRKDWYKLFEEQSMVEKKVEEYAQEKNTEEVEQSRIDVAKTDYLKSFLGNNTNELMLSQKNELEEVKARLKESHSEVDKQTNDYWSKKSRDSFVTIASMQESRQAWHNPNFRVYSINEVDLINNSTTDRNIYILSIKGQKTPCRYHCKMNVRDSKKIYIFETSDTNPGTTLIVECNAGQRLESLLNKTDSIKRVSPSVFAQEGSLKPLLSFTDREIAKRAEQKTIQKN